MPIRYTIHFSGRVQGVGFRYSTVRVAAGFRVAGFVQNLPDGRVKSVAEGEKDELTRFVHAVCDRMAGYISDHDVTESPATGNFGVPGSRAFGIR